MLPAELGPGAGLLTPALMLPLPVPCPPLSGPYCVTLEFPAAALVPARKQEGGHMAWVTAITPWVWPWC